MQIKMRYFLFFWIIPFCFFGMKLTVSAQSGFSLDIRTYTIENGLPNNHVYQCFQDHRGLMWMLISNTLNRFDGKKFQKVLDKGLNIHYTNNKIRFEDKEGDIWVRTDYEGMQANFLLVNSVSGKVQSPVEKYGSSFPKHVIDANLGNKKKLVACHNKR